MNHTSETGENAFVTERSYRENSAVVTVIIIEEIQIGMGRGRFTGGGEKVRITGLVSDSEQPLPPKPAGVSLDVLTLPSALRARRRLHQTADMCVDGSPFDPRKSPGAERRTLQIPDSNRTRAVRLQIRGTPQALALPAIS